MYQLIIFDWDGTLMDSAHKISSCLCAAASEVGLVAPPIKSARHVIGLGLTEAMQHLFPGQPGAVYAELVAAYKHQFLNVDTNTQALFDGVQAGLEELEAQGVMLAVATGKARRGLERAFAESDVSHLFTTTRCADETRSKPHPQMLHEILDFTAIAPEKAIMVGDTSFDMQMANNAGVVGLGVSYGVHPENELVSAGAKHTVDSFGAVIEWLMQGRMEPAFASA